MSTIQVGDWPLVRRLSQPRRTVWLVASLFATLAVEAASRPIADSDVWWVAAAGREMARTGSVPAANLFSFVEPEHPWIMHEWLFGPPYAWALSHIGPAAFALIAAAVALVQMGLVLYGTVGRARHANAGLLLAFVAVFSFGSRFLSARPTGVALIFLLAMAELAFARRFGVRHMVASSAVELAWTNCHGSFPLGPALLVAGAFDKTDRPYRSTAAGLSCLATLVNPYGLELHPFVAKYLLGTDGIYRAIHLHIEEFGTIVGAWGTTVRPADAVGLLFVLLLAVGALRRPEYRVRGLVVLLLVVAACIHARHIEAAGLVACILLVPYADLWAETWKWSAFGELSRRRAACLILAPACALSFAAFAVAFVCRTPMEWMAPEAPSRALLDAIPDGARVYAPFEWAGMTIWYDFPRAVRVFFDSRNDCYSAATFETFLGMRGSLADPKGRRDGLERSATDVVLGLKEQPLVQDIARDPAWRLMAVSEPWLLYSRKQTAVVAR